MRFVRLFLITLLFLSLAAMANAQATRTWVSGVGDDANPCSRTAPCKTFAGAISKTAKDGIINAVDPGGFGAVTITKSITIDGGPFMAGVLASGTNGININITDVNDIQKKVILRNLDIEGATTGLIGVNISSANKVIIENCKIYDFRAGTARGVHVNTTVANFALLIRNSTITNNGGAGVGVTGGAGGAASVVLESTQVSMNSSHGVDMVANAKLSFANSSSTQNAGSGIITEAASTDADISHSTLAFNGGAGVITLGGSTARLFSSSVQHNAISVSGSVSSTGNNEVLNNNPNTLPSNVGPQ